MRTRVLTTAAVTVAAAGMLLGLSAPRSNAPAAAPVPSAAMTFDVDTGHSSVIFKVKHLDVSNFYGRFDEVTGSFSFDPEDPSTTKIEISINADSINSNNTQRDGHLKSPDFFNVKQFPEITFESTKVEPAGAKMWVFGALTMLDETREVKVLMDNPTHKDVGGRFGHRAGLECFFYINRSDYGMTYMLDDKKLLGDEVQLIVSIEGMMK